MHCLFIRGRCIDDKKKNVLLKIKQEEKFSIIFSLGVNISTNWKAEMAEKLDFEDMTFRRI